jgi:phage repressor protein C with HTH and peptisase S24 domain
MTTPMGERVKKARLAAGYETGADAARALGMRVETYNRYENGSSKVTRAADRLARLFNVDFEWLLHGRGDMRRHESGYNVPVTGLVGAGAEVEMVGDTSGWDAPDEISLLGSDRLCALQVRGESQYPRFLNGEYVLYDRMSVTPETLIGQYAVVQTDDGRRLIKILRRSPKGGDRWRLESHNAPPEDDVQLIGAWRYLGVLPAK